MNVPNFIVHAAGSRGNRPDMGKRAYRLRFSIITHPYPTLEEVRHGMNQSLDELERQMKQQGFRLTSESTIRFVEKRPYMERVTIRVPRQLSSKEMLPGVMQGNRYRDEGDLVNFTPPTF